MLAQRTSAKDSSSLHTHSASLLLLHSLTSPPRETLQSAAGQQEANHRQKNVNSTRVRFFFFLLPMWLLFKDSALKTYVINV